MTRVFSPASDGWEPGADNASILEGRQGYELIRRVTLLKGKWAKYTHFSVDIVLSLRLQPGADQVADLAEQAVAGVGDLAHLVERVNDQRPCFAQQFLGFPFGACGFLAEARQAVAHHR